MSRIGIVGRGFVGNALYEGMKDTCEIFTYDKFVKDLSTEESLKELVLKADVLFLCVPTPMKKSGQCDISIVESVIAEIDKIISEEYPKYITAQFREKDTHYERKKITKEAIIVLKSTVPPGTSTYLNDTYKNVKIIFNPEFLSEKNSISDFKNQNRIILGGEKYSVAIVEDVYRTKFPFVPIIKTDLTTAEMVKYITNTFLATKVSFANEIYQICEAIGVEYSDAIKISQFDERLGKSHWQVPGPVPDHEGNFQFGFSGSCFPKDLNALKSLMQELEVDTTMLDATWEKNLKVRPEKDWELLIGRAVTKD